MSTKSDKTLWRAVLTQALKDVIALDGESIGAVDWLTSPKHEESRTLVFEYAGFEESNISRVVGFIHRYALLVLDGARIVYIADTHRITARKPYAHEIKVAKAILSYLSVTQMLAPAEATTAWLVDCFRNWNKRDTEAKVDKRLLTA